MTDKSLDKGYVAILGWSLNAIDAIDRFDRRYIIVAPEWAEDYAKKNDIPFMSWNFERLKEMGVDVAIPLCEETVEWAGAINSVLLNNPGLMSQALLFRDKALMKHRAQLGGIRGSIFEEAHDKCDVIHFLTRVTEEIEKLIETFDIDFGYIHPEYFVTNDGKMYFGEHTRRRVINELRITEETENDEYFEFHELQPLQNKAPKRSAFGTHCGLVYFFGDDPYRMHDLLKAQEELDFYL